MDLREAIVSSTLTSKPWSCTWSVKKMVRKDIFFFRRGDVFGQDSITTGNFVKSKGDFLDFPVCTMFGFSCMLYGCFYGWDIG